VLWPLYGSCVCALSCSRVASHNARGGWATAAAAFSSLPDNFSMTRAIRTANLRRLLNKDARKQAVNRSMSLTNASPEQAARAAKLSSRTLATLPVSARNAALDAIHDALAAAKDDILAANTKDLELAKKSAASGELSLSILKRLDLSRKGKFDDMLQGIKNVLDLEDPGRSSFGSFTFLVCFIRE